MNESNEQSNWCGQLGGFYAGHTIGTRTGYALFLCKGYDDPKNLHWCDPGDGFWYNQSLDDHGTFSNVITSLTCTNVVEEAYNKGIPLDLRKFHWRGSHICDLHHRGSHLRDCKTKIKNKPGIFTKCQNKWCLQKGLQKPQHTKCESVTNNGHTCNNPEIKYGTTTMGLPRNHRPDYEKWCEQLGGFYADHSTGTRTGYAVYGYTGADDPGNWHWCDYSDGFWYSQSLDYHGTFSNFITSITCMN